MLDPEFKILNVFLEPQNQSKALTSKEIQKLVKFTHEKTINCLKKLITDEVLIEKKKGDELLFSLNKKNGLVKMCLSVGSQPDFKMEK